MQLLFHNNRAVQLFMSAHCFYLNIVSLYVKRNYTVYVSTYMVC